MKSYQEVFAELKRRNVFKVAAVYGAVGFVELAALAGTVIWLPEYDALRSHPIAQAHLRESGLGDSTLRRTLPAEREMPVVLRDATNQATP